MVWGGIGIFIMLFAAPSLPGTVRLFANKLGKDEKKQHNFVVMILFKGTPAVLGPMIYVCTGAGRCLRAAHDKAPILDQCGSPVVPTFCVTLFIFWSWNLSVLKPATQSRALSWSDISQMRIPKLVAFELFMFALLGALAMVIFAEVDGEVGSPLDTFTSQTMFVFIGVWLLPVVLNAVVKPFMRTKRTRRPAREASLSGNRPSTFDLSDVGSPFT